MRSLSSMVGIIGGTANRDIHVPKRRAGPHGGSLSSAILGALSPQLRGPMGRKNGDNAAERRAQADRIMERERRKQERRHAERRSQAGRRKSEKPIGTRKK